MCLERRGRVRHRALSVPEGRLFWQKGSRIRLKVMCEKGTFSRQKNPLSWRHGRRFYLEGAIMGEKAPFRARMTPPVAGGARICLEWRRRGIKGRLFASEECLSWREGTHITPWVQKQTPD